MFFNQKTKNSSKSEYILMGFNAATATTFFMKPDNKTEGQADTNTDQKVSLTLTAETLSEKSKWSKVPDGCTYPSFCVSSV